MHVLHELSMTIQHEDVIKILIHANRGRCRYALVRIVISTLRSKVPDIIYIFFCKVLVSLSVLYCQENICCKTECVGPKRCLNFVF